MSAGGARPPEGLYLSAFGRVRAQAGGKTAAMLARNRLLSARGGVPTTVLTFDPSPDYHRVRAALTRRGELVEGMRLLNVFEWFRDLPVHQHGFDLRGSGAPAVPASGRVVGEHRRADGSVYLRLLETPSGGDHVVLLDEQEQVMATWHSRAAWHRAWLHALAGDARRVFLFTDTGSVLDGIWPVPDARFRLVHVLHEIHARSHTGDLRTAPLLPECEALFAHLERLDALVVLTGAQRDDVALRSGRTRTRLVELAHPVEPPPTLPAPEARDPATFVMMARLAPAKAIDRAVRAFASVIETHPEARLDVYGEGPLRPDLERLIRETGLRGRVTLRGYDPHAADALLTATAFVSTASKETFGLGIVEAMARGCPVIAYAVPYGPLALVDHGRDGYLVPDGDQSALAARIRALVEDPAEVARLSAGAVAKAAGFAPGPILTRWSALLHDVDDREPRRTPLG